jgi:hypothetical protein
MSNINLYAVLRNLEDLCALDKEMAALIKGKSIGLQFVVKGGPRALISFEDGKCTFTRGTGKNNIKLYFKSPEHFNDMILGKANPIPLKGFTKINFLKNQFSQLTDKLTYYLKPTEVLLKKSNYLKMNTIFTIYTAIFALAEIGNNDKIGKLNAGRIPNGTIQLSVKNGPTVNITVKDGILEAKKGLVNSPRASMTFNSIETANAMLNGRIDPYSCISSGRLEMKGYIPMIDNFNKLLVQVSNYLN